MSSLDAITALLSREHICTINPYAAIVSQAPDNPGAFSLRLTKEQIWQTC